MLTPVLTVRQNLLSMPIPLLCMPPRAYGRHRVMRVWQLHPDDALTDIAASHAQPASSFAKVFASDVIDPRLRFFGELPGPDQGRRVNFFAGCGEALESSDRVPRGRVAM